MAVRIPDLRALTTLDVRRARIEYRTESFDDRSASTASSTGSEPDDDDDDDVGDAEQQRPAPPRLPQPQPPQQPPPTPPPTPTTSSIADTSVMGVMLRRVTPPRRPKPEIKKPDAVVLRKVVKEPKRLGVPLAPRPKGSPPPVKGAAVASAPPPPKPLPPPPKAIPKTIVPPPPPASAPPLPPAKPVNLLLTQPPVEVLRIEGDKIIIIKRIPRKKPPTAEELARIKAEADAAEEARARVVEAARIRTARVRAAADEIIRQRKAARAAELLQSGGAVPKPVQRRPQKPAVKVKPHSNEPKNKEPFREIRQKVSDGWFCVCSRVVCTRTDVY